MYIQNWISTKYMIITHCPPVMRMRVCWAGGREFKPKMDHQPLVRFMLVWLKPILNLNNHIIGNDVYSCSCLLHPYASIERGCKRTCEIIIVQLYILKSGECTCTKGHCFMVYLNSDLSCHWFGWERWDQT